MSERHGSDPEAPFRACDTLGRLLAQGMLLRAECAAALDRAAAAAGDRRGCRTRLLHSLLLHAGFWQRERAAAAMRIDAALAPGLEARAPRRVLLAAARAADPEGALTPDEREAIALAAARRVLRGVGGGSRTHWRSRR